MGTSENRGHLPPCRAVGAMDGTARPGRAAAVILGAGAAVMLVAGVIEWTTVRAGPDAMPSVLMSADLFDELQRRRIARFVLSILLPAAAALSLELLPRQLGSDRVLTHRVALASAIVWGLGAAGVVASWIRAEPAGWFNYAPNSGVVFLGPGGRWGQVGPTLLMVAGLVLVAACLVGSAVANRGGWRTWQASVWPQLAVQGLVLVIFPFLALQLIVFREGGIQDLPILL